MIERADERPHRRRLQRRRRRPPGASSSPCSTTTTCSTPRALEHDGRGRSTHEPEVDYLYSDEDKIDAGRQLYDAVPQAGVVAGAAARPDVHLPLLGAAHVGGARGRRLPRRVTTAPRTTTSCCGSTERAREVVHVPRDPLPLAGDARLGRRRRRRQAVRVGGRASRRCRTTSTGSGIDADRRLRAGPGHLPHHPQAGPARAGSASSSRPAARRAWSGASAATTWSRRCARLLEHRRPRQPRGRRRLRRPAPRPRCSTSCARSPATGCGWCPTTEPFNFSEKCNIGVPGRSRRSLVLLNDDVEIVSDDFWSSWSRRCSRTASG